MAPKVADRTAIRVRPAERNAPGAFPRSFNRCDLHRIDYVAFGKCALLMTIGVRPYPTHLDGPIRTSGLDGRTKALVRMWTPNAVVVTVPKQAAYHPLDLPQSSELTGHNECRARDFRPLAADRAPIWGIRVFSLQARFTDRAPGRTDIPDLVRDRLTPQFWGGSAVTTPGERTPDHNRADSRLGVMPTRFLVFAKAPVAGWAKTRLIPTLGAEGAARLQAALIEHTLCSCGDAGRDAVELWCAPDAEHPFFVHVAKRFGATLHQQRGDDLGQRMFEALSSALRYSRAAVLVGTDAPTLTVGDLHSADAVLSAGAEAVLAPAFDGGYVLIGLRRVDRELFRDVEWGTARVLEQTRERLRALGYRWRELSPHHDIDRPEDWTRLIARSPEWAERLGRPPLA